VAHYYYKYFTRINPLPGPFPFPFIGNLPQIYWQFNGNISMFYKYCYENYGDIHEVYSSVRTIVICRAEYLEIFFSKNTHMMRFQNHREYEELEIGGKGITLNNNFKAWALGHHFFNQTILSPKFTNETIDWTNKLFNELEIYWDKLYLKEEIIKANENKLNFSEWFNRYTNDMIITLLTGEISYSMATYFNTLSDEKSDLPSAVVENHVEFFKALRKFFMGQALFFIIPPFLRHVPYFKNIVDDAIQSMRIVNQRLDAIIKGRRQEIEDIPFNKLLPHDMLTSMIIKNTIRDIYYVKANENYRPMTDAEIRANLRDGVLGGTYKVNFREVLCFTNLIIEI
jgi:deoxycytidylate deaminase